MGTKSGRLISLVFIAGLWGIVVSARSSAPAYEVNHSVVGATVTGQVLYVGALPKTQHLLVHRDKAFCGQSMPNEALVVDRETRGISAVIVSLDGVTKGKPFSDNQALIIENRSCRFLPRVLGAAIGTLEIKNADPILHNTHIRRDSRYGDNVVNVVQPAGGNVIKKPLREAGLLDVRCDAHPFMRASVQVFDHPYFTVTEYTGDFQLTDVPADKYELRAWHETLGTQYMTITVPAEGSMTVTIKLGPEA